MKGILFAGIAVAFFVLAWVFLRLARIFSTTERTIKDVSDQVVPLLGKTHVTVDNINSQLSQLDEAVGDVAGKKGEPHPKTTRLYRGVRGGGHQDRSRASGERPAPLRERRLRRPRGLVEAARGDPARPGRARRSSRCARRPTGASGRERRCKRAA